MEDDNNICKFFLEGRCCFGERCRNTHTEDTTGIARQANKVKKQKSAKHSKNVQEKENSTSKLPAMKTSRDVIARLQWDEDLPSEHFTIGYLDRFVGVIEQPFNAFDWSSDLASVDQNVLAIPQHRIQYFKYRGHKLWDKNERLDLIFGSTGTTHAVSIPQVLKSVNEQLLFQKDLITDTENSEIISSNQITNKPTHFLAIQISDTDLLTAIQDCLDQVLEPNHSTLKVSPNLYHVTLSTLSLETMEQVSNCKKLLDSILEAFFVDPPTSIQITGFGTYNDRVLYGRLATHQQFSNTVMSLLSFLRVNGVCLSDIPDMFHVTLLKGYNCLKNVDQDKLVELENLGLGDQPLNCVHLCSLHEAPDLETGFYRTVTSIKIGKDEIIQVE